MHPLEQKQAIPFQTIVAVGLLVLIEVLVCVKLLTDQGVSITKSFRHVFKGVIRRLCYVSRSLVVPGDFPRSPLSWV